MKRMKRIERIGMFLLISLFCVVAAGCPSESKETELSLWYYFETPLHQQALTGIVDEFNNSHDGITVKTEYVPFAEFKKQLSIGLAAEKLPDIVIIDNPDHAAYASMGLFADITNELAGWPDKDQFFPGPWLSTTLNGKNYGIPFGSNCLCLFYNKDMLDAAGIAPPKTWDELKVAAKKLTTGTVTGLGISAPKNEEGTFQFLPWLLSAGAEIDKLDSAEAVYAFSYLGDLVKNGSMSKEVITWTQGDVNLQFLSGRLAMMVNGPWQIPTIKKEAKDLNWNVVLIPKDKKYSSVLGGENWGIIAGDHVKEAVVFLKYVTQADKLSSYIGKFGYLPSRKDVASESQFTNDPVMSVFLEEMKYAMPRGPHPRWPEISDAMSTALQEVLTQTKSPADAAADAQRKVDALLN